MNIVKSERTIFIDVDDTLVMHDDTKDRFHNDYLKVIDPVDKTKFIVVIINRPMVRLLKEEAQRGSYVVVWSRGGWEWAKNVVLALELQNLVHTVMTKPFAYFDDSPVENWLKDRVYIKPDVIYKQTINKGE